MNMKSVRPFLFLFAITLAFLSGAPGTSQVNARVMTPDRLEIIRTIGRSGRIPAHEMVTQLRPVQDLYHALLALPVAPTDEVCPQYILANYQLTFFSHNVVVQKANALRGLCQPVTLSNGDVRIANIKFWGLMNKAFAAGKLVSTSVVGKPNPRLTKRNTLTSSHVTGRK